jgi:micrococcal nuclease
MSMVRFFDSLRILGEALLVAIPLLTAQSVLADVVEPRQVQVIDGDTITVSGKTIRLVGFIAPETWDAQCRAERDLGKMAASRLRDLIQAGGLDFSPVVCPCPTATVGRLFCNFGRACGRLKSNGRDVADILVAEGLAASYSCSKAGCPKTTRLWCNE